MLSRSKVMPVETVTGSFMICREMGQMKKGGTSGPSILFLVPMEDEEEQLRNPNTNTHI